MLGVLAVTLLASLALDLRVSFVGIWAVDTLGVSTGGLAAVYAIQALAESLTSLAAGRLADRIPRRRLAVASTLGSAAVALGLSASGGRPLLGMALIVAMGAVDALVWVACSVTLAEVVADAQLEKGYAAQRTVNAVAYAVGPPVAGGLVVIGFGWLFAAAAAVSCATAFVAWRLLPEPPMVAGPEAGERPPLGRLARDRQFAGLFAAGTLAYLAFFGTETVLPVALVASHAVAPAMFGLLFAINPLVTAAAQMPLTARLASLPARPRLVAGTLVMGCAPLLLVASTGPGAVAVVLVLFTAGELVWAPSASAAAARAAPPGARGAYLGALGATYSVGFALAPAAGFAARDVGGDAALWTCLAVSGAIAAGIYAAVTRPHVRDIGRVTTRSRPSPRRGAADTL